MVARAAKEEAASYSRLLVVDILHTKDPESKDTFHYSYYELVRYSGLTSESVDYAYSIDTMHTLARVCILWIRSNTMHTVRE